MKKDPRTLNDTHYLPRDVGTIQTRAGQIGVRWVAFHESGQCFTDEGRSIDEAHLKYFRQTFDALKPGTPEMKILVLGSSKPRRDSVLKIWESMGARKKR